MSGEASGSQKVMDASVQPTAYAASGKARNSHADVGTSVDCDILILEDEVLMQALLNRYLATYFAQHQEYSSLKIKTLASGWELIHADLSRVKVAIVDILLPQVTGVDLIRDFRKHFPNLGIVPISGMATEPMKRALKDCLPPGFDLLQKPLRKEEFLEAFEQAYHFREQPLSPSAAPTEEAGEQLWSTVQSPQSRTEIPTVHRKLLRKKTA